MLFGYHGLWLVTGTIFASFIYRDIFCTFFNTPVHCLVGCLSMAVWTVLFGLSYLHVFRILVFVLGRCNIEHISHGKVL